MRNNPAKVWNGIHRGGFCNDEDILKCKYGVRNERKWKVPISYLKTVILKTVKYKALVSDGCTRKEQRESEEELYLPENDVCRYVGCSPTKVGSSQIESWPNSPHFDRFLLESGELDGFDLDKLNLNRAMIGGGNSSMMENIRTMATPPESKFTYEEMFEAVSKRIHKLELPDLGDFSKRKIKDVRINPTAFSGYVTNLICGLTRREGMSFTSRVSQWFINNLKKKIIRPIFLWRYAVRPKANSLDEDGKILRARPIALCDGVLTQIASLFSQSVGDALKKVNYSELFIGRVLNQEDYNYLIKTLDVKDVFYASPDWSQFDNHIYEELMVVACGILEQCYNKSEYYDNYMRFVLESMIDKHIVLDSGHIYKLSKGLPSGHPLTSLVNSTINWILWTTIFNNICKRLNIELCDKWKVFVSGDDSLISFPNDIPLELFDQEAKRSGMKLDPFHLSVSPLFTTSTIKGAHFLRRTFNLTGLPGWDADYIFDRIRFVEDKKESDIDSLIRIENYILTAPDNNIETAVLRKYQVWLHKVIYEKEFKDIHYSNHHMEFLGRLDSKWLLDYHNRRPDDDWILWSAMSRPPKQTKILDSSNLRSGLCYIQHPLKILKQFRDPVQKRLKERILKFKWDPRTIGIREYDKTQDSLRNILDSLFTNRFLDKNERIKINDSS